MNIHSVSSTTVFSSRERHTAKGNLYQTSDSGKYVGLGAGAVIGGGLVLSQMRALNTISGKKNLIEGFHVRGKSLNDIYPRKIVRGLDGKIVPLNGQASDRSKKIVGKFKKTLMFWGAVIVALSTALGVAADKNFNVVRAKEADEKAALA